MGNLNLSTGNPSALAALAACEAAAGSVAGGRRAFQALCLIEALGGAQAKACATSRAAWCRYLRVLRKAGLLPSSGRKLDEANGWPREAYSGIGVLNLDGQAVEAVDWPFRDEPAPEFPGVVMNVSFHEGAWHVGCYFFGEDVNGQQDVMIDWPLSEFFNGTRPFVRGRPPEVVGGVPHA